jgi:hypothetical protein
LPARTSRTCCSPAPPIDPARSHFGFRSARRRRE